jgi:DNA invertase Pin-like site-specific DNA recombinase
MRRDRDEIIRQLCLYKIVVANRNRIVRAASDARFSPTEIEKYSGLSRTTIYRILGHGPTGEHT